VDRATVPDQLTVVPIENLKLDSDRRLAMVSACLLVLPTLWYVQTDLALYAGDWPHLRQRLMSRVVSVAGSVLAIVLLRRARSRAAYSRIVAGYAWWVAGFIVIINALRPDGATLPFRSPMFTLFVLYGTLPNGFWRQCTPAWFLSAALIALRLTWLTNITDGDIGGDVVIILAVNAFGTLLVQRRLALEQDVSVAWEAEHDARVTSDRAFAELRTLRGIIPICSHCRKVRSEVGDWEQLEFYVHAHSDAQFSHGICPECVDEHYPESEFAKALSPRDSGRG
jgi:hypothetical protein